MGDMLAIAATQPETPSHISKLAFFGLMFTFVIAICLLVWLFNVTPSFVDSEKTQREFDGGKQLIVQEFNDGEVELVG
ncbi:hypothetical protein I6N90_01615 [Paenibacillus sp. GSMTC-2017]|uniref:hypothetical protein n=1 Tax=Paenibacillus sp. GSMTC-2017 TaxID=2794350 RepID=UPI0018D93262|nr:hypothetical protein [Paenibacillus sp. GSMTC-2017]MBH5316502.1 hypothetical protein [Paenibacillus sp. GSMTC-2017]